jgi:hypothetical protein
MSLKTISAALLCLAASVLPAAAQGLLPGSFAGWTAPAAATQASAAQAEQVAADKAAVLREYGMTAAERREYVQGNQSYTVSLYRMVDPTAAFGAFTYLRDPQMSATPAVSPAAYAGAEPGRVIFVVGNLVVDLSSTSPGAAPAKGRPSDSDVKALATSLLPQADRRPFPHIAEYLPQMGLMRGSEHYVLGPLALSQFFPVNGIVNGAPADWIGFDKSAEAIIARYHVEGQPKTREAVLVIALYPTQQIAADKYDRLNKLFALNMPPQDPNGRPAMFGSRTGALVAMVSGVDSEPVASGFLKQIRYASDVTWNEPTHELTDPSIGTMVVGAFLGTGFIMVLAIAAGVGFGGIRLLVKLVLPGKVFDRSDQVEILQLGLSSKPIHAADFYSLK